MGRRDIHLSDTPLRCVLQNARSYKAQVVPSTPPAAISRGKWAAVGLLCWACQPPNSRAPSFSFQRPQRLYRNTRAKATSRKSLFERVE